MSSCFELLVIEIVSWPWTLLTPFLGNDTLWLAFLNGLATWNRHDLILCMNGHEKLPNNLVLDSLLSRDILYGMLKTYWKPLVCTLSFLSNSAWTYCMDIPKCSHELLMCFSPISFSEAHTGDHRRLLHDDVIKWKFFFPVNGQRWIPLK